LRFSNTIYRMLVDRVVEEFGQQNVDFD